MPHESRAFQPTPWDGDPCGDFLRRSAYGLGGIALAGLLDPSLFSGTARGAADTTRPGDRWRGVLNPPHLPVKAKRVIHLCMAGGPSQFESLDYKPS